MRSARREDPPQGVRKVRQSKSNIEAESRSDNKPVASSKGRVSPSRTHSDVDLCETFNAKHFRDGDLLAKQLAMAATPAKRPSEKSQ